MLPVTARTLGAATLAALLLSPASLAAPGRAIGYAGTLEDDGVPAEGVYAMTFELFAAGADSPLFAETIDVTVVGGAFFVVLGDAPTNPLPDALYLAGDPELGLTVDGEALSGRQRLLPVAFATDAARGEDFVVDGALTVNPRGEEDALVIERPDDQATNPARWSVRVAELGGLRVADRINDAEPFIIFWGARDRGLVLGSEGVGFGVVVPDAALHLLHGGDEDGRVALRFERDGSSGWTPQTWDVGLAADGGLVLRDATDGERVPFQVVPGAETNTLVVADQTRVGIGTAAPTAALHVAADEAARVFVENTSETAAPRVMAELTNLGEPIVRMRNSLAPAAWDLGALDDGSFRVSYGGSGLLELVLSDSGDLTVTGDVFSNTCNGSPCAPDYVFDDGYPLMPLADVERFVEKERHLPGVPSAEELAGPRSLGKMQMKLLEKVEELTLHTIRQQKEIKALRAELRELRSESR